MKQAVQLDLLDEIARFHHDKDGHEDAEGGLPFEYCREGLCALQFKESGE